MTYPLYLAVRGVPDEADIPILLDELRVAFSREENFPYLEALCRSPLPRVTAERLGALSLLVSLLTRAGISPTPLILCRDDHGRPYCRSTDGEIPPFDFNLSHSSAHVAGCLLVGDGRVGLDVEEPLPPARALPLLRRYATEGELAILPVPPEEDPAAASTYFTALWTRREAMAKQTGTGMPLQYDSTALPSSLHLLHAVIPTTGAALSLCIPRENTPELPILTEDSLPVTFL